MEPIGFIELIVAGLIGGAEIGLGLVLIGPGNLDPRDARFVGQDAPRDVADVHFGGRSTFGLGLVLQAIIDVVAQPEELVRAVANRQDHGCDS